MLTDIKVKQAPAKEKRYRLGDGNNLWLEISPKGKKTWRVRYVLDGKEFDRKIGTYPAMSLKEARAARDEPANNEPDALPLVDLPTDDQTKTFEEAAREWHTSRINTLDPTYSATVLRRLESYIFPHVGSLPINSITPRMILSPLKMVQQKGALDTAIRIKSTCSLIFRYAGAHGWCTTDPTVMIAGALEVPPKRNLPSITDPKEIGGLLRAIETYTGSITIRLALQLAPYVFVRPGELRRAEWTEFHLSAAVWNIPAEKMKMKRKHIVPLSRQAVKILEMLRLYTGNERYLFPARMGKVTDKPMSENTINGALRRLGYDTTTDICGHGFRSMASTLLNEAGWSSDAIERQLAHVEGNKVRAAYNYAQYLPERTRMMQAWADYLDGLKQYKHEVNKLPKKN